MVSVVYTPQKGLVEELGTAGVVRINSPIAEAQESLQLSGAKYVFTFAADAAADTDGSYFIIYDKAGRSYAFWFDVDDSGTAEPAPAAAADFSLEVGTTATGNSGAQRVAALVALADGAANFNTAFEFEGSGAELSVYVLEVGAVQGNLRPHVPTVAPVPKITVDSVADGQASPISNYGATSLDVLPQSDVTNVISEVALPDGDTIGQKKLIAIPVALSNGTLALTGKFTHAGNHARTRCVLAAAANSFLHCVWSGTRWATISSNGATFS